MKNGIIIDGKQYELQDVEDNPCDACDLGVQCDRLGSAMCVVLHGANWAQAYKCIEKTNDNGKEQNQD